jgi:hypothetical protein
MLQAASVEARPENREYWNYTCKVELHVQWYSLRSPCQDDDPPTLAE